MKWECRKRRLGWLGSLTTPEGRYQGHTLERGMEIIDEESRTPWVGWRCQWCGERFQLPGEPDCYDLPLMEDVETDAEISFNDPRQVAALALAISASSTHISEQGSFSHALDVLLLLLGGDVERWPAWRVGAVDIAFDHWRPTCGRGFSSAERYARAESAIRVGGKP